MYDEHILIKFILEKPKVTRKIFHEIKEELFTTSLYKKVVKRILTFYEHRNVIPTWAELVNDVALGEETLRKLKAKELKRKKLLVHDEALKLPGSISEVTSLIERLKLAATKVNLIKLQNDLTEQLKSLKDDEVNKLVESCSSSLDRIKDNSRSSTNLFKTNKENVSSLLTAYGKKLDGNYFLPTGFSGFDDINIGIPSDSFWMISGATGTGKSSIVIQLAKNMKKYGARICIVPLEMSIEQNLIRLASNLTGIKITDIAKHYKSYEKKLIDVVSKFVSSKDDESCIHFYEPNLTETLDTVLNNLIPNKYNIIFIDYINLMSPMGGDSVSQAYSLNLASRFAKRYASRTGTIICFVAQLDDKEKHVRYSRALQEDASNFWYWKDTREEIDETGTIEIMQKKSRNQSPVSFKLQVDLATCRFKDAPVDESGDEHPKKKTKKLMKGLDDIPSEDDI